VDIRDGGRPYVLGANRPDMVAFYMHRHVMEDSVWNWRFLGSWHGSCVFNDLLNASMNEANSGVRRRGGNKIIHTPYDHDMLRASGVY